VIAAPESHLVLGGARSGKSRHAVAQARRRLRPAAFVATARPVDGDMRARIERHRSERPRDWITVEEPIDLVAACQGLAREVDLIVVDCLTVWVANQMERGGDDQDILAAGDAFATFLRGRAVGVIAVSNETGQGVHPSTEVGLRFRDLLGGVNQAVAAAADRVTLMVAGIPVEIKGPTAGPEQSTRAHERVPEAP
jgi:adenosylcobinamide kinase/adenosylcobinamide-phosphate guanylyltransferase